MPPSKTPIGDALDAAYPDKTDSRRAEFKAAALADKLGSRSFQVSGCVGGRTVTVSGIHVDEVGALVCTITHPDIPVGANPFRFVNPPLGVYDANGEIKEDLLAAGREMLAQTVARVLGDDR